jgi:hypothetical protein
MPTWMRVTLSLLVASLVVCAADPALLNLVMPEARVLCGIDIDRAKASPLGQLVLSQMQSTDAQLKQFIATTGFDPRQDLHEILIASSANPKETKAVFLLRGSFDPQKVMTLARASGGVPHSYKGVELLAFTGQTTRPPSPATPQAQQPWLAFFGNTIAVLADQATMRATIDRRGAGMSINQRLASRASELSGKYEVWGVSVVPVAELAGKVPDETVSGAMKGDVLRGVLESSGGIRLGPDIEIAGEALTRSEKDANALADVVRFFVGLLQMSQKDAKGNPAASLLKTLDLRTEGNAMKLSWKIPQADVQKFIQTAREQAAKSAAAPRPQPSSRPAAAPKPAPPAAGGVTIHSTEMGTVKVAPQP